MSSAGNNTFLSLESLKDISHHGGTLALCHKTGLCFFFLLLFLPFTKTMLKCLPSTNIGCLFVCLSTFNVFIQLPVCLFVPASCLRAYRLIRFHMPVRLPVWNTYKSPPLLSPSEYLSDPLSDCIFIRVPVCLLWLSDLLTIPFTCLLPCPPFCLLPLSASLHNCLPVYRSTHLSLS